MSDNMKLATTVKSARQPEHADPMPRKRRASVALSHSHSPSPSRASKLLKSGDSAGPSVPPLPTATSDSPSSNMGDAEPEESAIEELESDEPSLEDESEEHVHADYSEPESVWPESDEIESESEKQYNRTPIDNATMSALKFRTKVVDEGEYKELEWCDSIVAKVMHAEKTPNEKVIGHAFARLIRRDCIRPTFHEDMEEASQDSSQLGFELFDRYGCLKGELIDHCVKKGSGAWGDEVDVGSILLVETVRVDKEWRRKGIGAKLVMNLWRKAKKTDRHVQFAFTWATPLNSEVRYQVEGKPRAERDAIFDVNEAIAIALFRSVGYRRVGSTVWFCFAADPEHSSHRIASGDDFNPQQYQSDDLQIEIIDREDKDATEVRRIEKLLQMRPLHHAITVLADDDCVEYLNQQRTLTPTTDGLWEAVDCSGNTILHLSATLSKVKSLDWIMGSGLDTKLVTVRNHEGYTPLEALQSHLESIRVKKELMGRWLIWAASDDFRVFSHEAVLCLLKLRRIRNVTVEEINRFRGGRTCGECINGFLSPRMSLALLFQAETIYDMLDAEFNDMDGDRWCSWHADHTLHISPSVRDNIRTNKSLRQGFAKMYDHIAECLRAKHVPNEPNVFQVMRTTSEWPPHTKNFLRRGGRVSDALSNIIDSAMSVDENTGTGDFMEIMDDEVRQLKKCRNDHEFGFVRFHCGLEQPSRFVPLGMAGASPEWD